MASQAFALNDYVEIPAPRGRPVEVAHSPARTAAENLTWHEEQLERLFTAFIGEEVPASKIERLPLATRAAVIVGGACLGWAMPIALAWSLVH